MRRHLKLQVLFLQLPRCDGDLYEKVNMDYRGSANRMDCMQYGVSLEWDMPRLGSEVARDTVHKNPSTFLIECTRIITSAIIFVPHQKVSNFYGV